MWSFEADMTGIPVYNGGGAAPRGFYRCHLDRIEEATERQEKSGCHRDKFVFRVAEGPHAGAEIWEWLARPDSNLSDEAARNKANRDAIGWFKGVLVSAGVPEDKLTGKFKMSVDGMKAKKEGDKVVPRVFHLDYTPKDVPMGVPNDVKKWLAPAAWQIAKAKFENGESDGGNGSAKATEGVQPEAGGTGAAASGKGGGGTGGAGKAGKATQRKGAAKPAPAPEPEPEPETDDEGGEGGDDDDPLSFSDV